jgi:bifunctional pyridoxal-dependent enzyme with beta-cystathionase and maltose regulon repressor activities
MGNRKSDEYKVDGKQKWKDRLRSVSNRVEETYEKSADQMQQATLRMYLFPYNPVGRRWAKYQIGRMRELCIFRNMGPSSGVDFWQSE